MNEHGKQQEGRALQQGIAPLWAEEPAKEFRAIKQGLDPLRLAPDIGKLACRGHQVQVTVGEVLEVLPANHHFI